MEAYSTGVSTLNYYDLVKSIDSVNSEDIDTTLESLVAQALVPNPDGANYSIAENGINVYSKRKTDGY